MNVIKHPHITEKAMDAMDFENTLQFVVDSGASKADVADAVERQFEVEVESVRTQNTMDGEKRATVRLSPDDDAEEVASRIGVF